MQLDRHCQRVCGTLHISPGAEQTSGRADLRMCFVFHVGLLEDVLAEIQAEHEANEAPAGQELGHAMSAPANAAHTLPQHSQQLQDNGFFT